VSRLPSRPDHLGIEARCGTVRPAPLVQKREVLRGQVDVFRSVVGRPELHDDALLVGIDQPVCDSIVPYDDVLIEAFGRCPPVDGKWQSAFGCNLDELEEIILGNEEVNQLPSGKPTESRLQCLVKAW